PAIEDGTASFLQANADGSTTVQPRSPVIADEPSILDRVIQIVKFRVDAGLTNSATTLTQSLVGGLVEIGLVPPSQAQAFTNQVLAALNHPPTLAAIDDKSVDEGSTLSFTATATDPDAGQTLTFSLDPGAPADASIDPTSGVFTWTPTEETGPVRVTVRVTDSGTPSLSDAKTFSISVTDPAVVATGVPVKALECQSLSGVAMATFTDPGGAEPNPSDLAGTHYQVVSIDWGDSTPLDTSSGAIRYGGSPGSKTDPFTVTGSHTYGE